MLPLSTNGRQWDTASSTPYFDFVNATEGRRHRVWYDDAESLRLKSSLASRLGLRGTGMWIADSLAYSDSAASQAMWAATEQPPKAPPPPPPPPPGLKWTPVPEPPVLVSDSPFNDYADSVFRLGGAGAPVFGLGAGRIEQNTDGLGHSWTSLEQWDGTPADPHGYNPADPFFGAVWQVPVAASGPAGAVAAVGAAVIRDWGRINSGCGAGGSGCGVAGRSIPGVPQPDVYYTNFTSAVETEFFFNASSGRVAHRAAPPGQEIAFVGLPKAVVCPKKYWPLGCPFWGPQSGGAVQLGDNSWVSAACFGAAVV